MIFVGQVSSLQEYVVIMFGLVMGVGINAVISLNEYMS